MQRTKMQTMETRFGPGAFRKNELLILSVLERDRNVYNKVVRVLKWDCVPFGNDDESRLRVELVEPGFEAPTVELAVKRLETLIFCRVNEITEETLEDMIGIHSEEKEAHFWKVGYQISRGTHLNAISPKQIYANAFQKTDLYRTSIVQRTLDEFRLDYSVLMNRFQYCSMSDALKIYWAIANHTQLYSHTAPKILVESLNEALPDANLDLT